MILVYHLYRSSIRRVKCMCMLGWTCKPTSRITKSSVWNRISVRRPAVIEQSTNTAIHSVQLNYEASKKSKSENNTYQATGCKDEKSCCTSIANYACNAFKFPIFVASTCIASTTGQFRTCDTHADNRIHQIGAGIRRRWRYLRLSRWQAHLLWPSDIVISGIFAITITRAAVFRISIQQSGSAVPAKLQLEPSGHHYNQRAAQLQNNYE